MCVCPDHQTETGRVGVGRVHESVCPETNEVVEQPTSIKVICKMQKIDNMGALKKWTVVRAWSERGNAVFWRGKPIVWRGPSVVLTPPKSVKFTHMHKCLYNLIQIGSFGPTEVNKTYIISISIWLDFGGAAWQRSRRPDGFT